MRLDDQVTDEVGALDGRRDEANDALARLREETGLQLFVVFVDSFDGTPAQQWADETAQRSDLGDRDALLAVATGDRAYAYSFDADFPLSDAQLDDVAATAIEPALSANDWAGAVVGAANGYRAALAGQPVPRPDIVPGDASPGGSSKGGVVLVVVLVAVVVCGARGRCSTYGGADPLPGTGPPIDPNDPLRRPEHAAAQRSGEQPAHRGRRLAAHERARARAGHAPSTAPRRPPRSRPRWRRRRPRWRRRSGCGWSSRT